MPHIQTVAQVAANLHSDMRRGISADEHEIRLDDVGHHMLAPRPVLEQFLSPPSSLSATLLSLGRELVFKHESRVALWVATILAFVQAGRDSNTIALAAGLLLVVAAFVQLLTARRFEDVWARLRLATASSWFTWTYERNYATVVRSGKRTHSLVQDLVPGDLVELQAPGMVPADVRIVTGSGKLVVDSSARPRPMALDPAPLPPHAKYAVATNMAFAGEKLVAGSALGLVVAIGQNSLRFGDPTRETDIVLDPLDEGVAGDTGMAEEPYAELKGTHVSARRSLFTSVYSASLVRLFRVPANAFRSLTLAEARLGGMVMAALAILASATFLLAGLVEGLDALTLVALIAVYLWLVLPDRMRVALFKQEASRHLGSLPRRVATSVTLAGSDKLVEATQVVITPSVVLDPDPLPVSCVFTGDSTTEVKSPISPAALHGREYDALLRAAVLSNTQAYVDGHHGSEAPVRSTCPIARAVFSFAMAHTELVACKAQHPCLGRTVWAPEPSERAAFLAQVGESGRQARGTVPLHPVLDVARHTSTSCFRASLHPLAHEAHLAVGVAPLRVLLASSVVDSVLSRAPSHAGVYVERVAPLTLAFVMRMKERMAELESQGVTFLAFVQKRVLLPHPGAHAYVDGLLSSPGSHADVWTSGYTLTGLLGVQLRINPRTGRYINDLVDAGMQTHLFSPFSRRVTHFLAVGSGILPPDSSLDSVVPPMTAATTPIGRVREASDTLVVHDAAAEVLAAGISFLADVKAQTTAVVVGKGDEWVAAALRLVNDSLGVFTLANHLFTAVGASGPVSLKVAPYCDMLLVDASLETIRTTLARARSMLDVELKMTASRTVFFLVYTLSLAWGLWFALPAPFTIATLLLTELVVRLATILAPALADPEFREPDVMIAGAERGAAPSLGSLLRFGRLFSLPLVLYALVLAGAVVFGSIFGYLAVMNRHTRDLVGRADEWENADPNVIGSGGDVLCEARSAFYIGLVVGLCAVQITTRTRMASLLSLSLRSHGIHLCILAVQMGLLVLSLYVKPFQVFFGTCGVSFRGWVFPLVFGGGILAADEVRKVLLRHVVVDPRDCFLSWLYYRVR